ncbi:hypothetical protein BX600DRAFT_455217, partial [Xylariales sp. PMI_506]
MMDDVVGLIMVQVVANLGSSGSGGAGSSSSFDALTVVRPVVVSLGIAALVPLVCVYAVAPITRWLNAAREKARDGTLDAVLRRREAALVIHTLLLLGLVIGASFAGTSSLLAAYIAGASVSWWDQEVPHVQPPQSPRGGDTAPQSSNRVECLEVPQSGSGKEVYEHYYGQAVDRVFKPFFFASIGFSIPVTKMFAGTIVWRGVVYWILMMVGKMVCGMWLLSFLNPIRVLRRVLRKLPASGKFPLRKLTAGGAHCTGPTASTAEDKPRPAAPDQTPNNDAPPTEQLRVSQQDEQPQATTPDAATTQTDASPTLSQEPVSRSLSLYPACIVAFAMVARGEIGYLISALAESSGAFGQSDDSDGVSAGDPSELFLVTTWAISLCTIVGPVCVGLLVGRVRRLERLRSEGDARGRDVLGAWGV